MENVRDSGDVDFVLLKLLKIVERAPRTVLCEYF